jgi:hypothetical protein
MYVYYYICLQQMHECTDTHVTNAIDIYIAQNIRKFIWRSKHTFFMKFFTTVMIMIQLFQIFVLSLGPGIFSVILFGSTQFLVMHHCHLSVPDQVALHDCRQAGKECEHVSGCTENPGLDDIHIFHEWMSQPPQVIAMIMEAAYVLNYLIFLWVHRIQFIHGTDAEGKVDRRKKPGSEYHGWSFMLVAVFNAAVVVMFLWSLTYTAYSFLVTWEQIHEQPDAGSLFKRCGKNTTLGLKHATQFCTASCQVDTDCDIEANEVCWENMPPPKGCASKLLENLLMVGYVLVPLMFAIVDMPISRSIWSPLMMIRSAAWYILFMPTFVAFFSA